MKTGVNDKDVWKELYSYRRKYYVNQLLKGLLILSAILTSAYLLINSLEFSFRFGPSIRTVLAFLFVFLTLITMIRYISVPLLILLGRKKGLSDEETAKRIGKAFPSVSDRLLNLIQLMKLQSENALVAAGIQQKSGEVSGIPFKTAIHLGENKKYLKYVLFPILFIVVAWLFNPEFFTGPTQRIIHFNKEFVPEAPFSFHADYQPIAFKNEDFDIFLELKGKALPLNTYLISEGRKIKLNNIAPGKHNYTFSKIQNSRTIRFEAAGFYSQEYTIQVVERPNLKNFNVRLVYPSYIGKENERLTNVGNLDIPEGTKVFWQFNTLETRIASIQFISDSSEVITSTVNDNLFEATKQFFFSDKYILILENENGKNKDNILFNVFVTKDKYPGINLNIYQDTVLYSMVALGGNISDDYGLTRLKLFYEISNKEGVSYAKDEIVIPINTRQASQGFYYNWDIDQIGIKEGDKISYHLGIWDNDGINGHKVTRTGTYTFQVPSKSEIKEEINKSTEKTEKTIDKSLSDAKKLEEKLKQAEERIKGKKDLDWKDEKLLKEILEEREKLNKALEELKQMNRDNTLQRERFSPQEQRIQEKSQQLQELMSELLDEETKKLYEELQKLLEEQSGVNQMQNTLEKLHKKETNLEKELERTLELFKRLKLEHQLDETINELNELAEEQQQLSEKTREKTTEPENLLNKQNELSERFEKLKEEMEKMNNLNQELKNPESMPDQSKDISEIDKEQEKSEELLEKLAPEDSGSENEEGREQERDSGGNEQQDKEDSSGQQQENSKEDPQQGESEQQKDNERGSEPQKGDQKPKNSKEIRNQAGESQEKAGQKMKKMSREMEQMQSGMEMEMMMENMEDMRNIVHNLITLSFDQEQLMKNFRHVNESDPRFVSLSQQQLKLNDDSRIIQDSLHSLSKRVFQIASFITRELENMNTHMDASVDALKERQKYKAVSEQQFSMTAMNNLALLLDDVLQQMMDALAEASGKSGKKGQEKIPSLSELQKQLNEKINELKESGKSGRELSEELAKLVAEQERIRKELQEMQRRAEQMNKEENGKTPGQGIPEKMEETEIDLANKKITEEMIKRQQDILTRLLEAENSLRERELEEERKGETARQYEKIVPKAFEEYLKQKEKEVEMLKTLPPKLYPYYKKEISDYFQRVGESKIY